MQKRTIFRAAASLAVFTALPLAGARAQSVEYSVQRIVPVPNASSTVSTGMNDLGEVVGWSQFFDGSPSLQGWRWTPSAGLTYLPAPPGLSTWRAMDVNEAGTIAGDGGFDFGQAWRFQNGTYEMLGVLPGTSISTAGAINQQGDISGTSRPVSFTQPPRTFFQAPGQTMTEILFSSWGTRLNDAGQIVGYSDSNAAYRYTPGTGVEFLGPLGAKPLNWAWSINSAGTVAGEAAQANGNGHVPFIFKDATGMQEIGNFGDNAAAVDINDAEEVVGNFSNTGQKPWIWTQASGVRFLDGLIDPSEGLGLLSAVRINSAGQIVCQALDLTGGSIFPVVLTPIDPPVVYCTAKTNSLGCVPQIAASGFASASSAGSFDVSATQVLNNKSGLCFYGFGQAALPFFGGTLCVQPPLRRLAIQSSGGNPPPADCSGSYTFDFNPLIQSGLDPQLVPGQSVGAQYWSRDPQHPDGTGVGLTDAVEFTVSP